MLRAIEINFMKELAPILYYYFVVVKSILACFLFFILADEVIIGTVHGYPGLL